MGAEKAASRLAELPEFANARTVKVNPDSPQRKVRELVTVHGKLLLMPAPRLRSGFLLLRPERVKGKERLASSIKGAFSLREKMGLDKDLAPDVLVVGSVAVGRDESRIGKGEGYSEIVPPRRLPSHSSVTTRIAMAVAIAPPMSKYCSNGNAPATPDGFTVNLTVEIVDQPA